LVWSPRGTLQRWQGSRRRIEKRVWEMLCNLVVDPGRSAMHFTSEEERRGSVGRLRVARSFLIPNGVDLPGLPRARRRSGAMRVLFMGRIDVIKGLENLIEAVGRLPGGLVTLKICGSGDAAYVASLQRLVRARDLDGQVQFAGQVTGAEREQAFSEADLLVLASHQESFGMVVVEALGRGLPVIASKGTPWAEIETAACGWWVDGKPAPLADALMAASGSDLDAMGARGRQWVLENFSWDHVARQQLREYEQMIDLPSPA
jgi:glycosyltransferase involved in cell wall biosynthesis